MKNKQISEYYLERYVLGELPDEDAEEIHKQVSTDPELRKAIEKIKSSNREILALYPPAVVKASLLTQLAETRSKKTSFPLRRILYMSSAFATVVLLVILILPGLLKKKTGLAVIDSTPDFSLVKGIPTIDLSKTQLLIFRKISDQVEILTNGDPAKAGDLLQLGYVAAAEPYGMIFSIDGRSTVTLHYPSESGDSTELEQNKKSFLPNAIELDDAPGFERFFFITSDFQIDVADILGKAENLARNPAQAAQEELDLPESLRQYSILIRKGEGS